MSWKLTVRSGPKVDRKRFDELTLQAQSLGAKGLVWAVLEQDGAWRSPVAKFLKPEEMSGAAELLGAVEGDAILAVADSAEIAVVGLGRSSQPVGAQRIVEEELPRVAERDRHVRLDGFAGVVVDPAGLQVVLGHAKTALTHVNRMKHRLAGNGG